MPFLENLVEGLSEAAGNDSAVSRIEKGKDRRQGLSDDYRKQKIAESMQIGNNIQKATALLLDPNTLQPLPGKEKQVADLRSKFKQVDAQIKQLYNPNYDPMAGASAENPIHKLTDKMHLTKAPVQPQKQDMSELQGQFGAEPKPDKFKEFRSVYREATGKDLPPEVAEQWARKQGGLSAEEKPDPENWTVVTGVTGDGKPFTFQHNSKSGESKTLDGKPVPPEQMQGFSVPPKGSSPKVGSLGEFLTNAYGPHPTPQQETQGRALWAQANAGTTVGEHVVMVPQLDGSIKAVTVKTTSHKTFGSGKEEKPPGQQKKELKAITSKHGGAGVASVGDTVGGKRTPTQNKMDAEYAEAVKLDSLANQVAAKPDDAINQKRLAVALERISAGRFTTQALDYIIKAGWGNTMEQWANNPSTGALPKDVMRQLVEGAHQNLKATKDARDAAFGPSTSGGGEGDDEAIIKALNGGK